MSFDLFGLSFTVTAYGSTGMGGEAKVGFGGVSFGLTFGVGGGFDVTWELKKGKKTNWGSSW